MEVYKEFQMECAHLLPKVPPSHKCGRLHGHSYRIQIHVRGLVPDATGWVIDFGDIKKAFQPLYDQLDHRYLNEVHELENPTSENLARWIWKRLKPTLPVLSKIVVSETCSTGCIYQGEDE